MAATRLTARAAAARAASQAPAAPVAAAIAAKAPKGFKPAPAPKAPKAAPSDMVQRLQSATYAALTAMGEAKGKVASMVLVIRECQKAKMDATTMGAHMQLGVVMLGFNVDAIRAQALLEGKRTSELMKLLDNLKMTKCRAMGVIAREDGTKPKKPGKGGKGKGAGKGDKGAKLLDPIAVPAPVNASAFHAQLLKVRVLLATALDQAKGLDGAALDLAAAQAALAALPNT
jgi:hypothetical protein